MATFKDDKGREWSIVLDAPLVKAIQAKHGVRLSNLRSNPVMELQFDTLTLVDVLYALCEKQAKASSITEVDFGESLLGSIEQAVSALEVAITDFCHPQLRSVLRSQLEKFQKAQSNVMKKALSEISEAEIEKSLTKRMKADLKKLLENTDSENSEDNNSVTSSMDST